MGRKRGSAIVIIECSHVSLRHEDGRETVWEWQEMTEEDRQYWLDLKSLLDGQAVAGLDVVLGAA